MVKIEEVSSKKEFSMRKIWIFKVLGALYNFLDFCEVSLIFLEFSKVFYHFSSIRMACRCGAIAGSVSFFNCIYLYLTILVDCGYKLQILDLFFEIRTKGSLCKDTWWIVGCLLRWTESNFVTCCMLWCFGCDGWPNHQIRCIRLMPIYQIFRVNGEFVAFCTCKRRSYSYILIDISLSS